MSIRPPFWLPFRVISRRALLGAAMCGVRFGPLTASARELSAAACAAVEISRLEAARAFDALYARMHPDAQAIIPREVIIGWYVDYLAEQNAVDLTVTDARLVDWTWPVNGVTYPGTAEINFVQRFFRRSRWVEEPETIHLAEANGEWCWFFGRSRAFVQEQIARYTAQATQKAPFILTDLGPIDHFDLSLATAINDAGWVAGDLRLSTEPAFGAFLRRDGRTSLLGPSPWCSPHLTGVMDLNDAGQIAGGAFEFETPSIPYVWQDGAVTALGMLPGDVSAVATAINNLGKIAGFSSAPHYFTQAADVPPRPVRFEGREAVPLPLRDGAVSGRALAINDAGTIAGYVADPAGREYAVLWRDAEVSKLGALPGDVHSVANAINSQGDAVGASAQDPLFGSFPAHPTPPAARAFLARAGTRELVDLGHLEDSTVTRALAINDAGWIVGASGNLAPSGGRPKTRAFLWRYGSMDDLNDLIPSTPKWLLREARAINSHGQIAGYGLRTDVERPRERAFLLTPALSSR